MALWKVTLFFQHQTIARRGVASPRIGGWTESWYSQLVALNDVIAAAAGVINPRGGGGQGNVPPFPLATSRAALLPLGGVVTGMRIQSLQPLAQAQSFALNIPGDPNAEVDVPQAALLCNAPGVGVANIRRFVLRGLPDNYITSGEFDPTAGFRTALLQFFAALTIWNFKGRDLSQPTVKIVNIATGTATTVTTETPYSPIVGNFVRILKTRDTGGNLRGGRFQVLSVGPGNNVFTIGQWTLGNTTGGSVRNDAIVYPLVDSVNTTFARVVTRRVGRPFIQYRGRRSRRR